MGMRCLLYNFMDDNQIITYNLLPKRSRMKLNSYTIACILHNVYVEFTLQNHLLVSKSMSNACKCDNYFINLRH
jgi:hypothetical protein